MLLASALFLIVNTIRLAVVARALVRLLEAAEEAADLAGGIA